MRKILDSVQWQTDHFEDIPVLVVACLRGGPRLPFPPMLASSYYGSIHRSVQNLLLAARAVGLGAALITLPLWNTFAARCILGGPWNVQPGAGVPLGWPLGRYGPTARRPVGEVVSLDRSSPSTGNAVLSSSASSVRLLVRGAPRRDRLRRRQGTSNSGAAGAAAGSDGAGAHASPSPGSPASIRDLYDSLARNESTRPPGNASTRPPGHLDLTDRSSPAGQGGPGRRR